LIVALERAAVRWTRGLALFGGWVLVAVAVVTVVDALLRYLAGRPFPGTFEATELFLAAIIFFGLPYTGLIDGHVSVDALTGRLGSRARHLAVALTAVVTAGLLGVITWQMASLAGEYAAISRTTITARIPVVPFIVPVTAAAGLATLASLIQAIGAAARVARPDLGPLPAPPRSISS
jgi:TRAP-type C4-dicarboxylate transport system permease small subunit